jgi:tRNA(Ile)-lysidine synthase
MRLSASKAAAGEHGMRVGAAGLAVRDAVRRGLADLAPTDLARSVGPRSVGPRSDGPRSDGARPDQSFAPATLGHGPLVLVACSGGPDSLALAAATAFVAPRLGLRAGAVIVDHQLQPGSAQVAATAAHACRELGLDPVEVVAVHVRAPGDAQDGPEAPARAARYLALDDAADRLGAAAVLLGHTLDDQAESVLLGLLRGSGARSLAGMAARRGRYRRPLLELRRTTTAAACAEQALHPWPDPHNEDPSYSRVRARRLLADLAADLGPGASAGLARSADLLRADADALDAWTERALADARDPGRPGLDCAALAALPRAVRTRVLHRAALEAGSRPADLSAAHVQALEALVIDWHGQGAVALPGPVEGRRVCGRLHLVDPATQRASAPAQPEE